jgi:hypothetical protein
MLVAGAVEVADGAPGRIRLATIQDFSAASLCRQPGSRRNHQNELRVSAALADAETRLD